MAYEREKAIAVEAVLAAAQLCQQVRADIPAAIEKSDKSPVTVADYGSQALICRALAAAFPDDPIVGEEDAGTLRQAAMAAVLAQVTGYVQALVPEARPDQVADWIDRGNGKVGARYWTLDPIDGTKGFLRQDQYAIALALVEAGDLKLGLLGCPALQLEGMSEPGALFMAVRGEGTVLIPLAGGEPQALRVAGMEDPSKLRFAESVESSHGDQARQTAAAQAAGITAASVRVDSQAKYGIVAAGQAALYLRLPSPKSPDYREKIWDHAAGALVVEEAGGRVTDMHGQPLDFSLGPKLINNQGIVASNGAIHEAVLAALRDG